MTLSIDGRSPRSEREPDAHDRIDIRIAAVLLVVVSALFLLWLVCRVGSWTCGSRAGVGSEASTAVTALAMRMPVVIGVDEMGAVLVGTCSWTDPTMAKAWYPRGVNTPEARLRHYAERFDTVEVDSSFYALPTAVNAARWAERTPQGFVFHVKAFGLLTGHAVDERVLPEALRGFRYEVGERGRVSSPEPAMVEEAARLFREALGPLRAAGKLGGVLMQYPPWFAARSGEEAGRNRARIERDRELLEGERMLVEFRHPSWVAPERVEETLSFLSRLGLAFVSVDAPRLGQSAMPPLAAATSEWAYVRFHGRNAATYFKRSGSAADRFDYLYDESELREWVGPVRDLAAATDRTFVMFNNCKHDYAPRNASQMALLLEG